MFVFFRCLLSPVCSVRVLHSSLQMDQFTLHGGNAQFRSDPFRSSRSSRVYTHPTGQKRQPDESNLTSCGLSIAHSPLVACRVIQVISVLCKVSLFLTYQLLEQLALAELCASGRSNRMRHSDWNSISHLYCFPHQNHFSTDATSVIIKTFGHFESFSTVCKYIFISSLLKRVLRNSLV